MPDIADQAQQAEQAHRLDALSRRDVADDSEQVHENGVVVCCDCGEPIPGARLRILPTACRCVECQDKAEGKAW
ncbi:MAG: TraR/DksA family transcriptional regulator [Desulfovibrio sp.]